LWYNVHFFGYTLYLYFEHFGLLLYFRNGEKTEYTGGRTADTIVSWVTKKSGPASIAVDCDGLAKSVEDNKFVIAYFGKSEGAMYTEAHLAYANMEDKIAFVNVEDAACAKTKGVEAGGMMFFRKFETTEMKYEGKPDKDSLSAFVKPLMVPTVFEFSEDEIEAVFGQQQTTIILFRSQTDKDAAFMSVFEEAAKTNKGKMLFSYSDVADGIQQRLAEFMGLTEDNLPTLRAIIPAGMKKYTAETKPADLTVEIITTFIDEVLAGKIAPSLKSEPIPEKQDEAVKVIVGLEYDKIVRDTTKDVFVKYYAPWCGHCKKLAEPWMELATSLADQSDIVIGKFDATVNEAEGVEVRGYPTLIFYPKDNKEGITYEGDRDVEAMKAWIMEKAVSTKSGGEAVKEDL
jgi:protein disulfide-isomerase A1